MAFRVLQFPEMLLVTDKYKSLNPIVTFFCRSGGGRSLYNNCILSEDTVRTFDVDLERNIDYDVYQFTGQGRNCRNNNERELS